MTVYALWEIARRAGWAPLLVLVLHEIAARLFGHEPIVDPVMHFLGGVACAFLFDRVWVIGSAFLGPSTALGRSASAFGMTTVMAVLWELGEFTADQLLRSHRQRGLTNTMRDLVIGMLGALILIAIIRMREGIARAGTGEQ